MCIKNRIKTLCLSILSMLIISSCISQPTGSVKCTLKGEVIDQTQSSQLILLKAGENPRVNGENIPINNGKFEYLLDCNHEELYWLVVDDGLLREIRPVEFISERGVINFKLHPINQYDENKVEGGKLNKEYQDYSNENSIKHNAVGIEINAKIEQLKKDGVERIDSELYTQILRENSSFQEFLRWKLQYAKEHPTIVGYCILVSEIKSVPEVTNDISQYSDIYQTIFAPKYPDHPYTTQMINLLTGSSLQSGVSFIDFTAIDLTGKPIRLSEQIAGKPAVLHLWASWCGPCRQKGKELIPVYEEFRNKGFVVIGVARERNSSAAAEAADRKSVV